MKDRENIPVQIGQVKIGYTGQSLNAILGSCIGIGFLFPAKGVYGLAHALLAESGGTSKVSDGRHVDHAVLSLLSLMGIADNERKQVQVFLAGGANMTLPRHTHPSRLVGNVNSTFARKTIREAKLNLYHEDVGGECGRRVVIDCTTGEFSIKLIPRIGNLDY